MAVATLDKDLVPVTNRYEITESRLNCFLHGYVLYIPNSCAKNVLGYTALLIDKIQNEQISLFFF